MPHIQANRIRETTTTTGTGNVTLGGAETGFQTFGSVMSNNDTCYYCIAHRTQAEWEVGIGTYVSATPALARTTVLASSNAGSLVNFSSGTKDVFITTVAERFQLPELTSAPSALSSGVQIWSRNIGGRHIPEFRGPSGRPSALQPGLFGNSIAMWLAGAGTTAAIAFGTTWTVAATQAHPAIANTNMMTSMRRATYTTTTTAGSASGVRSVQPLVMRARGFFFQAVFGILTYHSAMQIFVGLAAASGVLGGEPSAVVNSVFCGKDSEDSNWQIVTVDGSTASKSDTGRACSAASNTNIFEFTAFCAPNGNIFVRLVDLGNGTVIVNNVERTANLPTASTVLYAHAECRNSAGGAGTGCAIFLARMYIETDY